jgi:hypothetical protein
VVSFWPGLWWKNCQAGQKKHRKKFPGHLQAELIFSIYECRCQFFSHPKEEIPCTAATCEQLFSDNRGLTKIVHKFRGAYAAIIPK